MPPFLNASNRLQLIHKPTVSKGYTMIKFYTNFIIKRGYSYVATHELLPEVYVLSPRRERAIVFHGFDTAITFLRTMCADNIDEYNIVPVKN